MLGWFYCMSTHAGLSNVEASIFQIYGMPTLPRLLDVEASRFLQAILWLVDFMGWVFMYYYSSVAIQEFLLY